MQSQSTVIDKGLSNQEGQNHCFLNVIIQSLWNLRTFHSMFSAMADKRAKHKCPPWCGDTSVACLVCALGDLFRQFHRSDARVLPPDQIRHALVAAFPDTTRFIPGTMEDADETLDVILALIHATYVMDSGVIDESLLFQELRQDAPVWEALAAVSCNPPCPAHACFDSDFLDVASCSSCRQSRNPVSQSAFIFRVYTAEARNLAKVIAVDQTRTAKLAQSSSLNLNPAPVSQRLSANPPRTFAQPYDAYFIEPNEKKMNLRGTSVRSSTAAPPEGRSSRMSSSHHAYRSWGDVPSLMSSSLRSSEDEDDLAACDPLYFEAADKIPPQETPCRMSLETVLKAAWAQEGLHNAKCPPTETPLPPPRLTRLSPTPGHGSNPFSVSPNASNTDSGNTPLLETKGIFGKIGKWFGAGSQSPAPSPSPVYTMGLSGKCPKCQTASVRAERRATKVSPVFTCSLVWATDEVTKAELIDILELIPATIHLKELYYGPYPKTIPRMPTVHSPTCAIGSAFSVANDLETPHLLRGVVCYYGRHYFAFFNDILTGIWKRFDDATVRDVGMWEDVCATILTGNSMPCLLFYEQIEAVDDPNMIQTNELVSRQFKLTDWHDLRKIFKIKRQD